MEIDVLKKLIAIPSYLGKDNPEGEKGLADFILRFIKDRLPWLIVRKQKVIGKRFNLIVKDRYKPRLLFICHMDTVIPSGDRKRMVTPRIIGDRLYGLGAVDMKGGIAALLTALEENGPTKGIGLIFDCDEEYYFLGIKKILETYSFSPKIVICPEPTGLKIVNGCRGLVEIGFDLIGKTAHAGNPDLGVNSIEESVGLIRSLKEKLTSLDDPVLGQTSINLAGLNGGVFSDGKIAIQPNAVPDMARIVLDIRPANSRIRAKKIIHWIERIAEQSGLLVKRPKVRLDYPGYICKKDKIDNLLKVCQNRPLKIKYESKLGKRGFYEASFIANRWACPAISLGPGLPELAHRVNEYISLGQLRLAKDIYRRLII